MNICAGRSILITGATGSFGHAFVARLLDMNPGPRRIIAYSRDEWKQHMMQQRFDDRSLRYFIGDVRDEGRLELAMHDVDIVVHAAALKQVPACEYNPGEAIATNVTGALNVARAALECGVRRVVGLSSDKACSPANLYGATKLCAEKTLLAWNAYSGDRPTRYAVTRYGNIAGSRGSVIPFFRERLRAGEGLPVTDARMTRFWMTQSDAVDLVLCALGNMQGGEVFIPKLRGFRVVDLAETMAPGNWSETAIRPGEKLHESLISPDELRQTQEWPEGYRVLPSYAWAPQIAGGATIPAGWTYRSDTVPKMSREELSAALENV